MARHTPRDRPISLRPVLGILFGWLETGVLSHSKGKAGEREEVSVIRENLTNSSIARSGTRLVADRRRV